MYIAQWMDSREVLDQALSLVDGNQAELARRVQRSETTVSRWVTGRNGVDFESALRLARLTELPARQVVQAFGLDPDLLPIGDTDGPTDEAATYARRFETALRNIPRAFWAIVIDASIRMAQAMPDGSTPVTSPGVRPVTRPSHSGNRGKNNPSADLPNCKPSLRARMLVTA